MTPEQLDLIASSAAAATRERRGFGAAFYGRLFELAPEVRTLFPDDIDEQGDKLVDELAFLTRAATDLDSFVDRARDLGRRHDGYGVEESHYALVRQALLDALARVCVGDDTGAGCRNHRLVAARRVLRQDAQRCAGNPFAQRAHYRHY